ncbi:MAG: rhodanese-like domain-containing protein [Deltaproteobacteria bacterium]|jgi:rhodanese-related sulfurtransferase|nr:rhodanese-like domain-containing protein [Deltaproteobacteria bacterium]
MQTKRAGFIILIAVILFGFILPSCQAQQDQNITALSPKEALKLVETHTGDSDFVILDIRTPGEYQSGHLKNATMIDYYSKSFVDEIGRLDKQKSYLVYCRSGNRSARSMDLFKKLQFQKIYHLSSGINGWISEGLPLVK